MNIPDDELLTLHCDLMKHVDAVADLFINGPQVTLIVHFPGRPDEGLFLSNDIEGAIAHVRTLQISGKAKEIPALGGLQQ